MYDKDWSKIYDYYLNLFIIYFYSEKDFFTLSEFF